MEFEILKGKTLASVDVHDDVIVFTVRPGQVYELYHEQDCCESVRVEEVIGDVRDLIGEPILEAEEVSDANHPAPDGADSYTWTFYKIGTIKGHVTFRWLGESNGYYSESVSFRELTS